MLKSSVSGKFLASLINKLQMLVCKQTGRPTKHCTGVMWKVAELVTSELAEYL